MCLSNNLLCYVFPQPMRWSHHCHLVSALTSNEIKIHHTVLNFNFIVLKISQEGYPALIMLSGNAKYPPGPMVDDY